MKAYKAIVIDGKKIVRIGATLLLIMTVMGLVVVNVNIAGISLPSPQQWSESTMEESIPVIKGYSEQKMSVLSEIKAGAKKLLSFFMSFDVFDPRTVVLGEIPLVRSVSGGYLARLVNDETMAVYNPQNADSGADVSPEPLNTPQGGQYPIKEVDSGQAKAVGKGKILIRNETNYGIDVEKLLGESLLFDMKGDAPKVLIVHTHATESYAEEGAATYDSGKSDRSDNCEKNVVKIGEEMKKVFEEKGIRVIHDKTLHDQPNFNGSYENSRKTVEKYLKEYPEISIVLDVHRDAFVYEDGSKAKFTTEINGKKVAQLMLVVGTDAGGLSHAEWRENMKLALKFQKCISDKYPTLMRGVNLRKERFNGHTTRGSMIIEVGSSGNTLAEAVEGAKLGAASMADFLNTLK